MPTKSGSLAVLLVSVLFSIATPVVSAGTNLRQDEGLEGGRQAYEASDYSKAAQLLQA